MDLKNIRDEINSIDDRMKALFDERLACSRRVAQVKMEQGDEVFKPLREREIAERFAEDRWYLSYVRKVIELSRKYQYQQFIEAGTADEGFCSDVKMQTVFSEGGKLTLTLQADAEGKAGLKLTDILSVISDTSLRIIGLSAGETGKVTVCLFVENTVQARAEAYLLAYMLYKETIR